MLVKSTFLTYCWVCKEEFSVDNAEHKHHVVPRAYGGVDGPQVSLCSSHHTALHTISLRLYAKRPFNELLTDSDDNNKRLLWLASVACNARIITENDPNKKQVLILSPTGETLTKLKQLKKIYGNVSRDRLIELAVSKLHSQHFR